MINHKAIVQEAIKVMVRATDFEFFFEKLNSPDWIDALNELGLFGKPEKIKREGNGISYPVWAQSKYLIKIADKAPKKVMDIILSIETDNPRIHQDFIEAAAKMPVNEAKRLTNKIRKWLGSEDQYIFNYSSQLPSFILYLKTNGAIKEAKSLIIDLLAIRPLDEKENNDRPSALKKAKPILRNAWEYDEALKKISPSFRGKDKLQLIEILSFALRDSLNAESRVEHDYSEIWRPDIAETDRHRDSIKDTQVTWIKDLGEELVNEFPEFLSDVISKLFQRKSEIFTRLSLHLAHKSKNITEIGKLLLDPTLFSDRHIWTEYSSLLRDFYKLITPEEQKHLLRMIIEFKSSRNQKNPSEFDEKENDQGIYNYLHLIRDDLTGEAKEYYQSLLEKHETFLSPLYFRARPEISYGPNSPKTQNELKTMSMQEIKSYLETWQPSKKFQDPSIEGLARELEKLVIERFQDFAKTLDSLKLSESTYVRSIIEGINKAIPKSESIPWETIVDYLHWTATHKDPVPNPKYNPSDDRDPGWGWAKKAACRLVSLGLHDDTKQLPFTLRVQVWSIIESGLLDPDPDLDREKDTKDYYHVAINSIRGEALDSALQYGFWLKRNLGRQGQSLLPEDAPELFNVVADFLNLDKEPTKSMRAMLGKWIPWLLGLNKQWFKEIEELLLPKDASISDYWEAAWYTHLLYNQVYIDVFDNLSPHYSLSLDRLDSDDLEDDEKTDSRLVDHIVVAYLYGCIDLDSELFIKMYSKINLKLKRHIIWLVGRIISRDNENETIDKEIMDRTIALWNHRVKVLESVPDINQRKELAKIGGWIDSPNLSDEWLLDQMILALRVCHFITPDFLILDRLEALAPSQQMRVAEILLLMVDHKVGDHGIHSLITKSKEILPHLLANEGSKQTAIKIIHRLGALGYNEYGDLLRKE